MAKNNVALNDTTVDPQNLRPFQKFIMTIGEIPTSYKESMTYGEMLLGFCNFLEEKVIPTVNNNAEGLEEVQNLYLEIKNYVNSYFENLDVQEEINNKLDEMVESGELESIIATFLQMNFQRIYNTTNDIINDNTLIKGNYIKTLGYYEIGDGGEAIYIVTDTVSESDEYININNNLYAKLIPQKNTIYAKQFGCIADGETDDTQKLQRFFTYPCTNYIINKGVYLIDGDLQIINSNSYIKCENAQIKRKATNLTGYNIFNIDTKHDITIDNVHLTGDRDIHIGDTGEYGHCISILQSYNIIIKNSICEKGWGDGIYIALPFYSQPSAELNNITIDNCKILNNSRNGISICSGKNITIKNTYIYGTDRTNPRSAIDIEPSHNDPTVPYIENLIIDNVTTEKNTNGIEIFSGENINFDAYITNCKSNDEYQVYRVSKLLGTCNILMQNMIVKNIRQRAFTITNIGENASVTINNALIENNGSNASNMVVNTPIYIKCDEHNCNNLNLSNIVIRNNKTPFGSALYVNYDNNDEYELYNCNFSNIITPSKGINSNNNIFIGKANNNCKIDLNHIVESNYRDLIMGQKNSRYWNKMIINEVTDGTFTRTVKPLIPNGLYEIICCNRKSYTFQVNFTDFENVIANGNAQTQKVYYLQSMGGRILFYKYDTTCYIYEITGNWSTINPIS